MQCFVDCVYCYAKRSIQKNGVMTTDQIVRLIRQAKSEGVLHFDINGGEVLLHPGIFDILKTLRNCNYTPLVSTKIPIDEDTLLKLKECGINHYQLSLDSSDETQLKRLIRCKTGYISRIADTLKSSDRLGLRVSINSVFCESNCNRQNISELIAFLNQFDCIDSLRVNICGYSLYKKNFLQLRPSQSQVNEIESYIGELDRTDLNFDVRLSGYDQECIYSENGRPMAFQNRAICTGNLRNIVVLPNGDVTICEELYDNPNFIIGNVLNNSLGEIWNGKKALNLFNDPCSSNSKSACKDCNAYATCRNRVGVCWKSVLMAYGEENWDYPDPRCPHAPNLINEIYIR